MQDTEKTRGGFNMAGKILGVLMLIYFVCPFVYLVPFRAAYGPDMYEKSVVQIFFWPMHYLYDHAGLYQRLLDWEWALMFRR